MGDTDKLACICIEFVKKAGFLRERDRTRMAKCCVAIGVSEPAIVTLRMRGQDILMILD